MGKKFGMRMNSIFLMLLLLLGAFIVVVPGTAIAPHPLFPPGGGIQVGDYTYLSDSPGVARITGYTGNGGAVTIPSTLDGNTVTVIGQHAFDSVYGSLVTSVIIPSSVTYIDEMAFGWCSSLTSVTILDGVKTIGVSAFALCSSLTSVTIPNSVTTIGEDTFNYCKALTSVTIPNGVISIGDRAFSDCTNLTSVTIPNKVITLGNYAFSTCTALTSVTIPDSVTTIGESAFSGCTSLTSVTIGSGVTAIDVYAFNGCTSLTSITFLGLTAPIVVGNYWISNTNWSLMGRAYADSNFPASGEDWYGLTMGDVLPEPASPSIDSTMLYLAIGIVAVVVVIAVVVLMRKKK